MLLSILLFLFWYKTIDNIATITTKQATPTPTPTTTQSPGTYSYPTSSGGPSYSYPVGATTAAAPIVSQLVNNNSNNNQQEEKPVEETKEEIDRTGPCYDEEVEPDYLYGFDDHKGYIYMEDGKVTGIKYRYDYDTEEECKEKLEEIAEKYKDDKNIKDIYQKDNYIDIVFDEKSFEEKTIEEIIEEYFEGGIVRYGKNLL